MSKFLKIKEAYDWVSYDDEKIFYMIQLFLKIVLN